jgi:hypothetical protein
VLVCGLIYQCGSALYVPSAADQDSTGIMLDSLSEGRKLYVDHCGNCHNLYLPERYNAAEWEKNVAEMKVKSKITDSEKSKILSYLKCASKAHH